MIDRIQLILKTKNLSPSLFADEINVQRSSVSHILSGRNKPSLDFILKILTSYHEINSDWLMFGKGQMIKQAEREEKIIIEDKQEIVSQLELKEKKPQEKIPVPSFPDVIEEKEVQSGEIEKIVVLYKNKTFREYSPK
ncbi:MAG: helix-turn-helix transcriptional regulator [Bacteroidetes bacterium]|nr:helix-turn-helix transcriptional regulator [Bacteroidota bacterium]MBL7104320.1 helix-turn-helix transcriptional regulator [Bacteroidales bacterium]